MQNKLLQFKMIHFLIKNNICFILLFYIGTCPDEKNSIDYWNREIKI